MEENGEELQQTVVLSPPDSDDSKAPPNTDDNEAPPNKRAKQFEMGSYQRDSGEETLDDQQQLKEVRSIPPWLEVSAEEEKYGGKHGSPPWRLASVPRVNFYSIGRNAYDLRKICWGEYDDHLRQYIQDKYRISDAYIYDVRDFPRWGIAKPNHWGENYQTMEVIAHSAQFKQLIADVRPTLEAKLSQGVPIHNVVFACDQGRHRSVAAAKLFQGMLGSQPGRA